MYLDEIEHNDRANKTLAEMKKAEKMFKFHSKKIGKNTIVFCKNKDRIKEFERISKY